MKRALLIIVLATSSLFLASTSYCQYIYLDANGDAIHDSTDRLSPDTTSILVWLDTAHNRDGSAAACSNPLDSLSIFSYEFILHAIDGTVAYGLYLNSQPPMTTAFGLASDSTDFYVGFGGLSVLPPGLYLVGYLTIGVSSGNPSIQFADSTPLNGGYLTSFGSRCLGLDLDNTLKLGRDWFDADGLGAPDLPPIVTAPTHIVGIGGDEITIDVEAHDPDSGIDSLVADLSGLPPNNTAVFTTNPDRSRGTFLWSTAPADTGEYQVVFRASNSLLGAAATVAEVVSAQSVGPSLRLQLPMSGYRVHARFYHHTCIASGGLCDERTYYASDSGQIYIPLTQYDSDCCYWDRIIVEFHNWTYAAYFGSSADGPEELCSRLDLMPASNPGDRITSYTPSVDPWKARIVATLNHIRSFYLGAYGYAPPSTRVFFGDNVNSNFADGIQFPADSTSTLLAGNSIAWTLAHEYAHTLQSNVYQYTARCCQPAECHHTICGEQCNEGAWTEGMADGMAEYYSKKKRGQLEEIGYSTCGTPGAGVEGNVMELVYYMSEFDPKGFMDTFRFSTLSFTGQNVDHVVTVGEYYDVWRDIDPGPPYIVTHHPGTWNMGAMYRKYIERVITSVDVEGADAAPYVRWMSANPLSTQARLAVVSAHEIEVEIHLFDVKGRLLSRNGRYRVRAGEQIIEVPLGGLPSGVYFVGVRSGVAKTLLATKKVVVCK